MMRSEDGQVVRLENYRPTDFAIQRVDMLFQLEDGHTRVSTRTLFQRRAEASPDAELILDGDELTLDAIRLDGAEMEAGSFEASPERLIVRGLPAREPFELRVDTVLEPETNSKLMGLYRTRGVWCTQCEAEGFRRITYFLDRPDVLAIYRTRVEADRATAPVLLGNGNPVEAGDLPDGRHFAVWDDPHPKPSYLFALVAGDLDKLEDEFTTASGRRVDLAIYTEKGLAPQATYAMDALKRSMVWDEQRFGREYDLDVFNIVAVSDFNMGAMENKGLNVFNHKYVLLDPQTATDSDYAGVETVIAHEYFHNWTGNRITCRDWFQLCLKEGLTVYRDQEFSSDERSRTVKRISSVLGLKAHQFPEDQGPLQHPVRPTRYREISNFYTATVYDKGAELVRMIATLLGPERFRAGMDLYFERHDGEATTIEAFLACFEEAGEIDLSQFALWYSQAGTPELDVSESFDEATGTFTLGLRQHLERGAAQTGTVPMHIPVRFALLDRQGSQIAVQPRSGGIAVRDGVAHLTEAGGEIVFEGLSERPLLSVLRDFSAPVTLRHEPLQADRLALARLDPDPYGRWSALNDLVNRHLVQAACHHSASGEADAVLDALTEAAEDNALEPALRALILTLPPESEIARMVGENIDPRAVHEAREAMLDALANRSGPRLALLRTGLLAANAEGFSPDAESAGRRALANALLPLVLRWTREAGEATGQYETAGNMTDRLASLAALMQIFPTTRQTREALEDFFQRFRDNDLVIDKWFALQAGAPSANALETVEALSRHPAFRLANPNRARALIGGFASGNPLAFNAPDGEGYAFTTRMLAELDKMNPQTAARLATAFRSWRRLEPRRRTLVQRALQTLREQSSLSRDLQDILDRTLQ